jgi:hypothetical protein
LVGVACLCGKFSCIQSAGGKGEGWLTGGNSSKTLELQADFISVQICGIISAYICGKNKKNFPQIFADLSLGLNFVYKKKGFN